MQTTLPPPPRPHWSAITVDGHDCELFAPPEAAAGRAVIYLHDLHGRFLQESAGLRDAIEAVRLPTIAPRGGRSWWLDKPLPSFDERMAPERFVVDNVRAEVVRRFGVQPPGIALLGIGMGGTTPDGQFSLHEVECAGGCVNAPVVAVNDDYYEDVDGAGVWKIIEGFKRGEQPKPGPINGRDASAPIGPALTLSDDPTQPIPKQDFAAAKAAFEKAKAEAAAKAAAPKS